MKKQYNINAMRPAIILAHGSEHCNSKAINKDMIVAAGVDISYFTRWKEDVAALRQVVCDYVRLKHNHDVQMDVIETARNKIFPKWKTILETGEKTKMSRELRVSPYDVDSLVGYCESFMRTGKGTMITYTSESIFRKYVESLLGCRIAQNEVLDDSKRETLKEYYSAQKRINSLSEAREEILKEKQSFELMRKEAENEPKFLRFIDAKIAKAKEELQENKKATETAEADLAKVRIEAQQIEAVLRTIK